MAQRDVSYTSTSISKTHLEYVNQLKTDLLNNFKMNVTSQLICDYGIELVKKDVAGLRAYAQEKTVDPRKALIKKLLAELEADGIKTDDLK